MKKMVSGMAALALVAAAHAGSGVQINELLVNPPGTDNGTEFIELSGTPSASLSGLWFIGIEGDGTNAGIIDVALNLSSFSLGSNGLFLWRDSATVLAPAPDPATTLNVADFNPDIENGSQTFLIVSGFSGAIGNDLDTDNNGTLDVALPWASVEDALGILEDDGVNNFSYAGAFGGLTAPQQTFSPDALQRFNGGLWAFDVLGTTPGPFANDPAETVDQFGNPLSVDFTLTPGSTNIPEPSTAVLLALGALAFRRR